MINQIVRLVSPRRLDVFFKEENIGKNEVVVKPKYLSICAADQRYYMGTRKKEVLDKKLPLCLIHEATGEVLYDPQDELPRGRNVVLVPNTPHEEDSVIKENYRRSSSFCSSNTDGFMRNLIVIDRDRLLDIGTIDAETAALTELISVALNAIEQFERIAHSRRDKLGVWGDGSVGYITALMLKVIYPQAQIYVFGTNPQKLHYFSFADETFFINHVPKDLQLDHAFECVGSIAAADAVGQIIRLISPQGAIGLMGVSENPVRIDTRMVLEKGLLLFGNSRSGRSDFARAIEILHDRTVANYVRSLISEVVPVEDVGDIYAAFDNDVNNPFKTLMRWHL